MDWSVTAKYAGKVVRGEVTLSEQKAERLGLWLMMDPFDLFTVKNGRWRAKVWKPGWKPPW